MANPFDHPHFTILGRTPNLVLHGDAAVYVRATDRWVISFDNNLGNQRLIKRYQTEVNALQKVWESQPSNRLVGTKEG